MWGDSLKILCKITNNKYIMLILCICAVYLSVTGIYNERENIKNKFIITEAKVTGSEQYGSGRRDYNFNNYYVNVTYSVDNTQYTAKLDKMYTFSPDIGRKVIIYYIPNKSDYFYSYVGTYKNVIGIYLIIFGLVFAIMSMIKIGLHLYIRISNKEYKEMAIDTRLIGIYPNEIAVFSIITYPALGAINEVNMLANIVGWITFTIIFGTVMSLLFYDVKLSILGAINLKENNSEKVV